MVYEEKYDGGLNYLKNDKIEKVNKAIFSIIDYICIGVFCYSVVLLKAEEISINWVIMVVIILILLGFIGSRYDLITSIFKKDVKVLNRKIILTDNILTVEEKIYNIGKKKIISASVGLDEVSKVEIINNSMYIWCNLNFISNSVKFTRKYVKIKYTKEVENYLKENSVKVKRFI